MKILLISLNAKYIHTCLAIRSLKAYACGHLKGSASDVQIETAEYTINQSEDDILRDICRKKPDFAAFSCYIWNIEMVRKLAYLLRIALPALPIWAGGPEVSFNAPDFLKDNPAFSGIMTGEGELTFTELVSAMVKGAADPSAGQILDAVPGIVFRNSDGRIMVHDAPALLDLDALIFPYESPEDAENRIFYYESSRGCPFQCSYCLSSIDRKVRFKSVEKVYAELLLFLKWKIPLVKFVDRTFNCDHNRTLAIWRFIRDHDNGVTRFHFEITGDLLNEEELALLETLRPGLVQLEIGVQSVNPETLHAIHRQQNAEKLKQVNAILKASGNIHCHLDLIAGLPYEDMESFGRSFDAVYEMYPSQLQLGFLKLLKGSEMHRMKDTYGLCCRPWPPYEVAATRWLSSEEILELKAIEEMVETYYNSGQFHFSLAYLLHFFPRPWLFFKALAKWMEQTGNLQLSHARQTRYDLLRCFALQNTKAEPDALDAVLLFDLYQRENLKTRPAWAPDAEGRKKQIGDFYADETNRAMYLPAFRGESVRQIRHETHMEFFSADVYRLAETGRYEPAEWCVLFNYRNRDPLDASAEATVIPKTDSFAETTDNK